MPCKYLMKCAVILRTAQGQHLIAIDLIPPGTRSDPAVATEYDPLRSEAPVLARTLAV